MQNFEKGATISLPAKEITQAMICEYADAADDHNPLHIDEDFAKTTSYGGTIAHGMLSMAFIQELMVRNFGVDYLTRGAIEVSFTAPVRPGDMIETNGKVTAFDAETGKAAVQVICQNQSGEKVLSAKCSLRAKDA
ncbi:MAG: MaoC family dehydratase [Schwartzia sp.]|nr:MaoC family dehydratase [Schwartzia sp. (in: firmicutes)]